MRWHLGRRDEAHQAGASQICKALCAQGAWRNSTHQSTGSRFTGETTEAPSPPGVWIHIQTSGVLATRGPENAQHQTGGKGLTQAAKLSRSKITPMPAQVRDNHRRTRWSCGPGTDHSWGNWGPRGNAGITEKKEYVQKILNLYNYPFILIEIQNIIYIYIEIKHVRYNMYYAA